MTKYYYAGLFHLLIIIYYLLVIKDFQKNAVYNNKINCFHGGMN